jgi:hypothetical protein
MTYLAGTEAKVVVWVATEFEEAHRSAIRWLNEQTVDPFAFFAVQIRVVRIGDSPYAPIFEILESPNEWDRRLQATVRDSGNLTPLGSLRRDFWTHLIDRYPREAEAGRATGQGYRWRARRHEGLVVAQYLAQGKVGVFLTCDRGVSVEAALALLEPHREFLESRLGVPVQAGSDRLIASKKGHVRQCGVIFGCS